MTTAIRSLTCAERLSPSRLLWCTVVGTVVGWAVWEGRDSSRRSLRSYAAQSSASLALVLVLLSPILKTLAHATTSDSITSLTCALFGLSALLADYRAPRPTDKSRGGCVRSRRY